MGKLELWDLLNFSLIQDKEGVVFGQCLDSEVFRRIVLPAKPVLRAKPKNNRVDDPSEFDGTW